MSKQHPITELDLIYYWCQASNNPEEMTMQELKDFISSTAGLSWEQIKQHIQDEYGMTALTKIIEFEKRPKVKDSTLLRLKDVLAGSNIKIVENGDNTITISSTGGSGTSFIIGDHGFVELKDGQDWINKINNKIDKNTDIDLNGHAITNASAFQSNSFKTKNWEITTNDGKDFIVIDRTNSEFIFKVSNEGNVLANSFNGVVIKNTGQGSLFLNDKGEYIKVSTGSPEWGAIIGDIQNQADLISLLSKKVDKIDGKQLSTNDFTNELKQKLENVPHLGSMATKNDAPSDGKEYSRKNNEWIQATGGGVQPSDLEHVKDMVIMNNIKFEAINDVCDTLNKRTDYPQCEITSMISQITPSLPKATNLFFIGKVMSEAVAVFCTIETSNQKLTGKVSKGRDESEYVFSLPDDLNTSDNYVLLYLSWQDNSAIVYKQITPLRVEVVQTQNQEPEITYIDLKQITLPMKKQFIQCNAKAIPEELTDKLSYKWVNELDEVISTLSYVDKNTAIQESNTIKCIVSYGKMSASTNILDLSGEKV